MMALVRFTAQRLEERALQLPVDDGFLVLAAMPLLPGGSPAVKSVAIDNIDTTVLQNTVRSEFLIMFMVREKRYRSSNE